MSNVSLNPREREIVLQCMKVVRELIDERELHSRMGITAEELETVVAQWPNIDDGAEGSVGFLAVNNSLNEVCHGVRIDEWDRWFDAPPDEIRKTYQNWLERKGMRSGIR